jgi:hypothetical protein
MLSSANGDKSFQLEFSAAIAEALRHLQRRASREGRGAGFLSALRKMVVRLRTDPTEFGESLYRLPALRMQIRCAVVRPLVVHFGVCEDRPLVFIKTVSLI